VHEAAVQLSPGDPAAWTRLSEAYEAAGSLELSAVALTQAVRLEPAGAARHFNLGALLSRLRRWRDALPHFQEALRLDRDRAHNWRAVGRVLDELEQYGDAARHLQEALRRDPGLKDTRTSLGWALYRAGRWDEAVIAFEEAAQREPHDFWLWLGLGVAYDGTGRYDDAAAAYRLAQRIEPTRGALSVELGRVLLHQSRPADALPHLERAARLRPEDPEVWCGIVDAHYGLGNLRAAIEAARHRVRVDPDSEAALLSLADLLCRDNRYAEAVRTAGWLMRKHPRTQRNAVLLSSLGISLAGLKDYDLALKAHRFALHIDPSLAGSWHNMGFILGERGSWGQAVPFYRRATEAKPDWPRAWRDLGRALYHCRRADEAVAACRKALDLDPRSAESQRVLRHALAIQNDSPASPGSSPAAGPFSLLRATQP